jgi:hypothetical protein
MLMILCLNTFACVCVALYADYWTRRDYRAGKEMAKRRG